jgi:hypothetical protein
LVQKELILIQGGHPYQALPIRLDFLDKRSSLFCQSIDDGEKSVFVTLALGQLLGANRFVVELRKI